MPDKPGLCTPVVGPLNPESTAMTLLQLQRCCAALIIRRSIQPDYSDAAKTLTLVWAGPRQAAESAHNMTLQSRFRTSLGCQRR